MARLPVGLVEVDRCSSCGGIWFDMLEEEKIIRAGVAAAIDVGDQTIGAARDAQRIDCPRCHTRTIRMVDAEQPHIHFESCKYCYGRFFDAGEFRDLAGAEVAELLGRWRTHDRPIQT
jgi:Zn-finger nucleic acid-binding protein